MSVVGTQEERASRAQELQDAWSAVGQRHPYDWLITTTTVNNHDAKVEAEVAAPGIRIGGHNRALQFYKKLHGVDPRAWNADISQADLQEIIKKRGKEFHTYQTASALAGWLLFQEAKRKWTQEYPGEPFPVEVPEIYLVNIPQSAQAQFDIDGPLYDGAIVAIKVYPADVQPVEKNPQALLNAKKALEYLAAIGGAWQIYDENQLAVTPTGTILILNIDQPAETDPRYFPYTTQNAENISPELAKELQKDGYVDKDITFHYGHAQWVKNDEQPKLFAKMENAAARIDRTTAFKNIGLIIIALALLVAIALYVINRRSKK